LSCLGVDDNSGLDRTYTVFGKVFRGMDVVDKIVAAARDEVDNPLQPMDSEGIAERRMARREGLSHANET
jgi:cyclophilin family peptidyl-prolyl cis-trans isomerase